MIRTLQRPFKINPQARPRSKPEPRRSAPPDVKRRPQRQAVFVARRLRMVRGQRTHPVAGRPRQTPPRRRHADIRRLGVGRRGHLQHFQRRRPGAPDEQRRVGLHRPLQRSQPRNPRVRFGCRRHLRPRNRPRFILPRIPPRLRPRPLPRQPSRSPPRTRQPRHNSHPPPATSPATPSPGGADILRIPRPPRGGRPHAGHAGHGSGPHAGNPAGHHAGNIAPRSIPKPPRHRTSLRPIPPPATTDPSSSPPKKPTPRKKPNLRVV